jgi:HD-GYP domain-containing protein (c-di-GMP phosphodiesterase class II)
MVSARPYRIPTDLDQAMETLLAGAGRQWDAGIVAICIAMLRDDARTPGLRIS